MHASSGLGRQRAEVGPLLVDLGVITLDDVQLRHGHARDQSLLFDVRHHAVWHAQLVGAVVVAWLRDDVALLAQPGGGLVRQIGGEIAEDLEVGACLPWWVDRGVERVQVRVHIRRGHVVLFVPGSRREHQVRDQGGRGIAEVGGHHQIELADGHVIGPLDGARAIFFCQFRRVGIGIDAQQVAEEELGTFRGGAQQVGTPVDEDAWPVLFCRWVVVGELQVAFF